jgi:hypothetical protein
MLEFFIYYICKKKNNGYKSFDYLKKILCEVHIYKKTRQKFIVYRINVEKCRTILCNKFFIDIRLIKC